MATINLGSIKFKWKGTYAGGTAYTVDDVVEYNGSSYICILASTGNLPTNATYFEQMSSAGTNGTDGTDLTSTLTTQGDIVYRDGSGLQRLGAGTSGQFLKTQGTGANPVWGEAGGKFESQLFHIVYEQPDATNGGTASNNSWYTITLNTIKTNEISGASITSNQITLPTGTYFVDGHVFLTNIGYGQTRLRNNTDNSTVMVGNNVYAEGYAGSLSPMSGRFTLSSSKTLSIDFYVTTQYNNTGFGFASPTTGEINKFHDFKFWKIA